MKSEIEAIKKLVFGEKKNFVITTHHKPDADALGSSLAWYQFLVKFGHSVTVISPSDFPRFLHWMPLAETVLDYSLKRTQSAKLLETAEAIFCLDFNALARLNDFAKAVQTCAAPKIMIDHHIDPESFASITLSDITASATCEIIFDCIYEIAPEKLDISIGECLYAGIMTDTGSFRHPSATEKTHQVVATLKKIGVNTSKIHQNIFDQNSLRRLQFLGYVLSEKLVVLPEYKTAYIHLSREELLKYNSQTGDTEGFANYALSLENVVMVALFIDRKEGIKISFRSIGDFSVQKFSATHFNGGGHKNASGGILKESLEETVEKFCNLLPLYQSELLKIQK